jgi:hypothetical protein
MARLSARWKLALVGLACYVAVAWYFGGDLVGTPRVVAQEKEKGKAESLPVMYYGVAACSNEGCHGGSPPKNWIKDKPLLCRCNEALDWHKKDKHADAYNVLTRTRGQQMAKILGYDVTKADVCLVCHGVVIKDPKLLAASKENLFKIDEGVNCVVCHGAHEEWVGRHSVLVNARKWRPLSRAEKEAQGGMRNLWDPIKRAELCVSCHIGSHNEGKFVTHDMYAAGHPPLPGFEAASFSEQMPRHWQYLRAKPPEVQKEQGYKSGEEEQTELVLIGAAVSLRETMSLLEEQAKNALAAKDDNKKVLDLSNFDCYACHHDLKAPSWRQKRGYPGKPGRVPMRPWSTELAKLGIVATSGDSDAAKTGFSEFNAAIRKVNAAFDARPYGNPAAIASAAGTVRQWAEKLAKNLNSGTIDTKAARALLGRFSALYVGSQKAPRTLDYDSAREVAWAFEVIYNELNDRKKGDARVRKDFAGLDALLKLRLPKGREKIVEDELQESLERINAYNPTRFRELFSSLTSAVSKKP